MKSSMDFSLGLAIFLLTSTVLLASPSLATEERTILGSIQLDKTTISQFANTIKDRGCEVIARENLVVVTPGCFDLPGNPAVKALSDNESRAIDYVWLEMAYEGQPKDYLTSLQKTYGKPTKLLEKSKELEASWKLDNLSIELKSQGKNPFTLLYTTPAYEKKQKELEEQRRNDRTKGLDQML